MDLQCDTKFLLCTFPRVVFVLIWNFLRLPTALQTYPCNENSIFPMRKFSQGKPVFITGNPVLIAGIPVMKTGFPLWEFPHKENPLLITGIGLQCSRPRYLATSSLKKFFLCIINVFLLSCLNTFLQRIIFHFPCMKAIYFCRHALSGGG